MNLLEKINAEEFKKLLDFKAMYPTLGEELVKALTEKEYLHQLTLNQAIELSRIFEINYATWLAPLYESFKSKP